MARSKDKSPPPPRIDRTRFEMMTFEEADRAAREYWWSRTPDERMAALERLREKTCGYTASNRSKFVPVMRIEKMK